MSLPPGFLDELRSRLALSDIAGRKVTWDRRRSNPAKGDWWAPCPFHQEKTASFHVDDRKGFYYCFGCHAKGDLIGFVRETENLDFVEAVGMLAREAGLEMPAPARDPRAAERRDRLARLAEIMEEAVRAYGRAFRSGAGQGARDYARGRGLAEATLKRFEIGFAPADRHFLSGPFREKGVLDDAVAAGLVIVPEDGGAPFDRFRNRLMFPIRDPSGRCIAFGGRAMSPEARAKYLNSPETELFHKGHTLFNHGPAREAAGKSGSLVVAEGYMDVIALVQAGFEHAVAPLGTAVTEEQLGLIWRIAPEPIIALDGDRAGFDAAERLVDLALPKLEPGRSLRFCLLPEGQDPDDLIRSQGRRGMQAALDDALPLVELLWRREIARGDIDTPERKASLNKRFKESLRSIRDRVVREYYRREIQDRWHLLFPQGRKAGVADRSYRSRSLHKRSGDHLGPAPSTLSSELAHPVSENNIVASREATVLLIAIKNLLHIDLIELMLESMTFTVPEYANLRDMLLSPVADSDDPLVEIARRLGNDPIVLVSRFRRARAHPYARPIEDGSKVELEVAHIAERHQALLSAAAELAEARRELAGAEDERWTARIRHAKHELITADTEAVARSAEAWEHSEESVFQRMLDAELWRKRKKP